jgi:hypothetical protein
LVLWKKLTIPLLAIVLLIPAACNRQETSSIWSYSPFLPPGTEGYTVAPVEHWHINATADQVARLEKRWGRNITFGTLLKEVFPEKVNEIPGVFITYPLKIEWPASSVNWDQTVSGGYRTVVTGVKIVSGSPEPDQRPVIEGSYGFHFYIGKHSLEFEPELPSPDSGGIPYYFISIYIPE